MEALASEVAPLSIVVLDDDEDFLEYMRVMLESDGHDVRVCATPPVFFAACESRLPDIVLLDIKMGRTSGEDLLTEIRQRWSKLCVIVVTGYPSLEGMRQTFKREVFDYIAKPFSKDELLRVFQQAAQKLGLGQRPLDRLRRELGRQIRLARTQRGWTLKELSESSGISVSQLSSVERGTHLPSVESLTAIAAAMERKPSTWMEAAGF